ncbi:unnamed protein product, partial [Prorocentrum cordatum]
MSDFSLDVVLARVTKTVAEGVIHRHDGGAPLADASFVDDLAARAAANPCRAIAAATAPLQIVESRAQGRGARLNAKKSKIMLLMFGTASRNTGGRMGKEGVASMPSAFADQSVEL